MNTRPAFHSRPPDSAKLGLLAAVAVYVSGLVALGWINITLLCRGDEKWASGCGFAGLYIGVSLLMFAPGLVAGFLSARAHASAQCRSRLYVAAAVATLPVAAIFYLFESAVWGLFAIPISVAVVVNVVRGLSAWLSRADAPRLT